MGKNTAVAVQLSLNPPKAVREQIARDGVYRKPVQVTAEASYRIGGGSSRGTLAREKYVAPAPKLRYTRSQ